MHDASDFFTRWETPVDSYDELMRYIDAIDRPARAFVWRGVSNSKWSFHSSLYRRLYWSDPLVVPDEGALLARETDILIKAHRWGLHRGEQGRLSILEQLAIMQHYGAPTRLIDVSFNPLIAAWFAVQADRKNDNEDGRLFAVDVKDRRISEISDAFRKWEDRVDRPWMPDNEDSVDQSMWRTSVWAWKPPAFVGRLSRQNAGFLFGGVPSAMMSPTTGRPFQIPKGPKGQDGRWTIEQVRQHTSLALRFHLIKPKAGGVSPYGQPAYTMRISARAKPAIRTKLEELHGYTDASLYADFPGFAEFATPDLPLSPPKPDD